MEENIFKETSEAKNLACDFLMKGEIVAIKAETVYGLVCDAGNQKSISKIYQIKKRPDFNPLIIHVNSQEMAEKIAFFNDDAIKLVKKYWPGPLTLILPKKKTKLIHDKATAGLRTVAVRMPKSKIFLEIISLIQKPVAAPSANKSGYITSTNAAHVKESFGDNLKIIIDSGKSTLGLESTIIDMTKKPYLIRRLGVIIKEDILNTLGIDTILFNSSISSNRPNSPGQLSKHYSPKTPLILNITKPKKDEAFLAFGKQLNEHDFMLNLSVDGNLKEAAHNLYDYLRRLDKMKKKRIVVSPVPYQGIGEAINERLNRASQKND